MLEDYLPCAILVPSLGRPHRLKEAAENIHLNTDLDHHIVWCVGGIHSLSILSDLGEIFIDDTDDPDKRYVTRMNKLIGVLGAARTVFFGSDDVIHHDGWLREAITQMEQQRKAVIVVNDLRNPNGTQALVRADYLPFLCYDDPMVAFHPGYFHNFADTEQFMTAAKMGQLGRALESRVEHLHPIYQNTVSRPWDDTYRNAFIHWNEDAETFNRRMAELDALEHRVETIAERFWP